MVKNHDGIYIHNGHPVEFPYRHIWEGEITKKGKGFGGLHHDPMGALRQQGFIRNIRVYADGFYEAEVLVDGQWIDSSFSPETWSCDKVMESVIDVLNRGGVMRQEGRFSVFEDIFIKDPVKNIKIRVVIDDITGKCKTFYPNLRN